MALPPLPTVDDVLAARDRIAPYVRRTPALPSRSLSAIADASVFLKLENVQDTRSFKVRGAFNALLCLDDVARARGVVCASTGNHGLAVSYAARRLGCRAVVCLGEGVPRHRVAAIEALGAEVRVVGRTQDDAMAEASRLAVAAGMTMIHPFDDPAVIAGQGTIALELIDALLDLDMVVVPVSGGGLVSGISLAVKALVPHVRVVGVSALATPTMAWSVAAGRPLDVVEQPTLADNLAGGIGAGNQYTLRLANRGVDDWPTISEDALARALRHLETVEGVTVEGAGAAPVAVVLERLATSRGGSIALVLSGGNVAPVEDDQAPVVGP